MTSIRNVDKIKVYTLQWIINKHWFTRRRKCKALAQWNTHANLSIPRWRRKMANTSPRWRTTPSWFHFQPWSHGTRMCSPCVWVSVILVHTCEMQTQAQTRRRFYFRCVCVMVVRTCVCFRVRLRLRRSFQLTRVAVRVLQLNRENKYIF